VLELNTDHVQQRKANLLKSLVSPEEFADLKQIIEPRLLRQDCHFEPLEFVVHPSGDQKVLDDSENVPDGGMLVFLDPSPKLPSSLLANRVAKRVLALKDGSVLRVLLVREKISKLSDAVKLDTSLMLELGCAPGAPETVSLKTTGKQAIKPAVIELKRFMDPGTLA